jgi:hypothetical protein
MKERYVNCWKYEREGVYWWFIKKLSTMAEAFPLDWPLGYKRTQYRKNSNFKQSAPDRVQQEAYKQLNLLKAKKVVISSNLPLRKDGGMYAEYLTKKIEDPGIAIYFNYEGQDVVMCCDQYTWPIDNLYALAKGIEAIRSMNRWGVSDFIKRAFTGFKALPETAQVQQWHEVLGVPPNADKETVKSAYRRLAQVHHPDTGGSVAMFNRITEAYQQAMKTN